MNISSNQQLIKFLNKNKHNIEFVRGSVYSDSQGNPHDEIVLLYYKRSVFEKVLDFFFETTPVGNGISFAEYLNYSKFDFDNMEQFEISGIKQDNNTYKKPANFLIKLFMKNSIYAN